tara:strand:- start:47 stop:367 length:321 start_codon:yes stop_codon:yes gene_type:complete
MKKKKIGIKNLKYCEWMSRETNCFKATVTVDDEDFCHAQDEGKGGMTYFYPIDSNNYKPIDELEQWCKDNLPKWTSKYVPEPMDMTLEILVGDLVCNKIERGEYAK